MAIPRNTANATTKTALLLLLSTILQCITTTTSSSPPKRPQIHPPPLTRRHKHRDYASGKYPLVDYNNTHPYEILARHRRSLQSSNSYDLPNDYNPEYEHNDPNYAPPHLKFSRDKQEPIRIRADYLKLPASTTPTQRSKNTFIKYHVMPVAIKFWSDILLVYPVRHLFIPPEYCYYATEDHIRKGIANTDLMVYVNIQEDCVEGMFGVADSCDWDQYDRPVAGTISFCYDALQQIDHRGRGSDLIKDAAIETAIHELGHVLGFRSRDIAYFYDWETGLPRTPREEDGGVEEVDMVCIEGDRRMVERPAATTLREGYTEYGVRFFEVVTPRVLSVARSHFNCPTMTGARLENQPTTDDCFGDHWEERLFFDELLSGVAIDHHYPEMISPLTLALFEDSGWYTADYTKSEISPFGHAAGCDFVNKPCIVDGKVPPYSKGFFCDTWDRSDDFNCDPSHNAIATCDLINYANFPDNPLLPPPTEEFQYFERSTFGGREYRADYCPTWSEFVFSCHDTTLAEHLRFPGETFGLADSRCLNVVTNDGSLAVRPLCLQAYCDLETKTVKVTVHGEEKVCEREDQTFEVTDKISFACPKFQKFCPDLFCPGQCSGRGTCNFSTHPPMCLCDDPTDTSPGCTNSFPPPPAPDNTEPKIDYGTFVAKVKGEFHITVNVRQDLTDVDLALVSNALENALGWLLPKGSVVKVVMINGMKVPGKSRRLVDEVIDNNIKTDKTASQHVPSDLNVEFEILSSKKCHTPSCSDLQQQEDEFISEMGTTLKEVIKKDELTNSIKEEANKTGIKMLEDVEVDKTQEVVVESGLEEEFVAAAKEAVEKGGDESVGGRLVVEWGVFLLSVCLTFVNS